MRALLRLLQLPVVARSPPPTRPTLLLPNLLRSPTITGRARLVPGSSSPAPAARAMASSQKQFPPPQQQGSQPGKEHAMDPRPEAIIQNYKAANKLKDKVALVTGGDSGIGRAVCLLFAAEGASVAFTFVKGAEDKDAEETLRALRDIASRTGAREPMALPADLGYEDSCRKVVEEVAAAHGGRIDVLVNNAAEQHERRSITDVTESDLDRVFRTNIC